MNHLAHLFLVPDSLQARVGSLLGDFMRGVDPSRLPFEVQLGLQHHWKVDAFTDKHPEVLASKRLFSTQRRRFAGIILDVLYDHYLLVHWERFTHASQPGFIRDVYADLERGQPLMPVHMARVTRKMVEHDWFTSYQNLDNIGYALDRIAGRIRFANQFHGAIAEVKEHRQTLEQRFLVFFPELMRYANTDSTAELENLIKD